jgi:hypothetical protein
LLRPLDEIEGTVAVGAPDMGAVELDIFLDPRIAVELRLVRQVEPGDRLRASVERRHRPMRIDQEGPDLV